MKVRFWGVRGSIPVPEADKMRVGGNTSCVELELNTDKHIILDAGTGIRALGDKLAKAIANGKLKEIYIFLSHTHWDHIQGFPFFAPAFIPKFKIHIFGSAKANRKLERVLSGQMEYDYFPVKFSQLPSSIDFIELQEGFHTIFEGFSVLVKRHIHPGIAYGYRLEYEGKSVVYSTDTEHFQNMVDKRVVEISEGADLLIHDSQFTDEEMDFRLGWGHSTWKQSIAVAKEAKVKNLALFHMDQSRTDEQAFAIEKEAQSVFQNTFLATEGMELEIR